MAMQGYKRTTSKDRELPGRHEVGVAARRHRQYLTAMNALSYLSADSFWGIAVAEVSTEAKKAFFIWRPYRDVCADLVFVTHRIQVRKELSLGSCSGDALVDVGLDDRSPSRFAAVFRFPFCMVF